MSVRSVSGSREDDFGNKLLKGAALVGGLMFIGYLVKDAAEKNRVKEECKDGVLTGRCLGAVARTSADAAVRAAPVAAACLNPVSPATCFTTIGAQARILYPPQQ